MYKLFFFLFTVHINFIQIHSYIHPIVETENGKIQGKITNDYISFHSVPYAEPPINENRYELPKPIEKNWTDILDCTKLADECLQWNHFKLINDEDGLSGNENCLYLNIYTPDINTSTELFPVIVFIHGGAFQYGTGNVFRPDLIMKNKNAIVVTIAYRLGPLGFLSTEDEEISGNLGLKDQKLALNWIKRNINNFGGDPDHISLTGFSAGGASVHLHLLTQNMENLFSSAISFSGTAFCPWVLVENPLKKTTKLASILNCSYQNTKELKNCLKKKSAEDIVRAVSKFQFSHYFPFRIFGPVIEPNTITDSFLNKDIETLIKLNDIEYAPWIVAYTSEDGAYNGADLMKKTTAGEYIEKFWDNFDELAPQALFYGENLETNETQQYSSFLKEKYNIENKDANLEKYFKIQKIFTDELFANGALKAIQLHKKLVKSPLFAYIYDNPSPKGIGNLISQRDDIDFGCTHGDDVFLMFNVPHRDSDVPFRDDELELSKKFLEMLVTFAKTGLAKFGYTNFPVNKNDGKTQFLKISRNTTSVIVYDD